MKVWLPLVIGIVLATAFTEPLTRFLNRIIEWLVVAWYVVVFFVGQFI